MLCGLCTCILLICMQSTAEAQAKPSASAQMVYKTLEIANLNERIFEKLLENPPRGREAVSEHKMHPSLQVEQRNVEGFSMLTITSSASARKHIFLLHGGAYVAEANAGHRRLIELLAGEFGYRVTFIDYPLAPEHDILTSLAVLEEAYKLLVQKYPGDVFCLMGDSAGGGLALSLLQHLRNAGVETRPEKTVLFSPWLDVSLTNPGIDTLLEKDVLLHREGLVACGKLYAGGLEPDDPRLSPIYGDLDELAQIKVFVSTHELFYPDCMLLLERAAAAQGTDVHLSVKAQMLHDWVILPLRERDEALNEVARFF